jgi:riboflavin kinase/FMN adenylyltransferase
VVELIRDLDRIPDRFRRGAVAIGKFDGVHRGHALILQELQRHASRLSGATIAFTFDPAPVEILRPEKAPVPMCDLRRKAELLDHLDIDALVAFPATREFLEWDARTFFERILRQGLDAKAMVQGRDFLFGKNRSGDIELLQEYCREADIALQVVKPLYALGRPISSSRIRALLHDGQVAAARSMLTEPYRIRGKVIAGRQRGRKLGYPTANLSFPPTLLPKQGIYAGIARVDGERFSAAINIGPNITFAEKGTKIEVHLLDFEGNIYGKSMDVDFLERLRDIVRYPSAEQLTEQMKKDILQVRRVVEKFLQNEAFDATR